MEPTTVWKRRLLAAGAAIATGAVLGSLVQTQINLAALVDLGVMVTPGQRMAALGHDLVYFAPVYAVLLAAILVPSFVITAGALGRLQWRWPTVWYALGAALGLWAGLALVNHLAPMPTLIAATRYWPGLLMMMATAGVSGWVFALMIHVPAQRAPRRDTRSLPVVVSLFVLLAFGSAPEPAWSEGGSGSAPETTYRVETLVNGLSYPWALAFLPGGDLLITERTGTLKRWHPERGQAPVNGLPPVYVSGQAGLFDVLLAPDFAESSVLFLAYACGTEAANHLCVASTVLAEGTLANVKEVFRTRPAKSGNAHFGGRLAWYEDGSLIVSLGDGFDFREHAQRLDSHLGKIVRIWPDGRVPLNNPFVGQGDALPEIFSLGHRNIQGLLYDHESGRLLAHEHGPRGGDEMNHIHPGGNYGWPIATRGKDYTGALVSPFSELDGVQAPLIDWTPSIAPSGFTLYRGHQFPAWQGQFFVGALADRSLNRVSVNEGQGRDKERLLAALGERVRDVRSGPDGALYLLTDAEPGRVIRIESGAVPNPPDISLSEGELAWIGERIFENECASRQACLVHWNDGEAFPSLGIGHFIWYPEGASGRFTESFPGLIQALRAQGAELPSLLAQLWQPGKGGLAGAPWSDQASFTEQASSTGEVDALRAFLYQTRGAQVKYILDRAKASLNAIVAVAPVNDAGRVRERLWQLSRTPGGVYALMDYVNFKGEGLAMNERYDGEGWGLLQVLLEMDRSPGLTELAKFRAAAGTVLTRRAELADNDIERERWLPGWLRRVDTYREPGQPTGG